MAEPDELYVTVRDDGWAVKRGGREKAWRVLPTQAESIQLARNTLADGGGGWLNIQNRDGQWRERVWVGPRKRR